MLSSESTFWTSDYWKQNLTEAEIAAFLAAHFPLNAHPGFMWRYQQEGVRDHHFGCRLGPETTLTGIVHDLAHAVDFGPENFSVRLRNGYFNFKLPHKRVFGERYIEPQTMQISINEARVNGIEIRLLEILGFQIDKGAYLDQMLDTLKYLPDAYLSHNKAELLKAHALSAYHHWDKEKVLLSLTAWLDLTHKKLTRQAKKDREFRPMPSAKISGGYRLAAA